MLALFGFMQICSFAMLATYLTFIYKFAFGNCWECCCIKFNALKENLKNSSNTSGYKALRSP